MKWAARYRARLRAAFRAALGAWRLKGALPGQSLLTVYVIVSDELLASRDPAIPQMVAHDAYRVALRATRGRMGLAT